MEELISKLKDELGTLSPSEEILFNELIVSLKIMEKANAEITSNNLLTNITRNKDKDPYFQINRYLQIRNEQFKIFMKLFESMNLTPKEKSTLKDCNTSKRIYDLQGIDKV
jgi:hypothetical protein